MRAALEPLFVETEDDGPSDMMGIMTHHLGPMPIVTSRYDAAFWMLVMTTRHDGHQFDFTLLRLASLDGVNFTTKFQNFKLSCINCTRY